MKKSKLLNNHRNKGARRFQMMWDTDPASISGKGARSGIAVRMEGVRHSGPGPVTILDRNLKPVRVVDPYTGEEI